MGIKFDKVNPDPFAMICPTQLVNSYEAGSIYFVMHKPGKENDSEIKRHESEKKTHYALAIDMTGSSNTDYFIATHYDLYVVSSTNYTTHVESTFKEHAWDHYSLIQKLGKIPIDDILRFHIPTHFAKHIEYRLINDVFNPLCEANKGPGWSSILNCQSFTRASIEHLGYEFPSTVHVTSDCIPTLMDSLIKAKTNEKSTDKLSISSRNQKVTLTNTENNTKKKLPNKRTETVSKTGQTRIATRSSQKSPLTPMNDENNNSFMSNIQSGFLQFVNQKKRQLTIYADENQPPNHEIHDIEHAKLIYETADGHTKLARAAATDAYLLANRNASNARYPITINKTYN
ncbi:unnamed protein product [Rotaria socialis]|uniref:Uncharacterized protein n=1 Tax=Rotaria socialis TaxID=392032 RepID=A0A821G614_9BILA|nr:unnamed protein product [Rotaria socialis]